ncbi:hypothetical protein, partial [Pseudooceanicola sp.]
MTFKAILFSTTATRIQADDISHDITELSAEEALAVTGGMPVPDLEQAEDSGNEADEGDEGN